MKIIRRAIEIKTKRTTYICDVGALLYRDNRPCLRLVDSDSQAEIATPTLCVSTNYNTRTWAPGVTAFKVHKDHILIFNSLITAGVIVSVGIVMPVGKINVELARVVDL